MNLSGGRAGVPFVMLAKEWNYIEQGQSTREERANIFWCKKGVLCNHWKLAFGACKRALFQQKMLAIEIPSSVRCKRLFAENCRIVENWRGMKMLNGKSE